MKEPAITFGDGATETVLSAFGFTVDENRIVYDENNVACRDRYGLIHEDEVGGIVHDGTGGTRVIRDNFCEILDYVKWKKNIDMDKSDSLINRFIDKVL